MSGTPPPSPPPAVQRIAQQTQRREAGVVEYRLHRVFDVHAGPFHRHDDMELLVIAQNAQVVKVRVLHDTIGGREADASVRAQVVDSYEHPKPFDVFRRPYDLRYVADYAYVQVDPQTYRFTSLVHDAAHGDGTFQVSADDEVEKVEYTPNAFPPHASSGTVSEERAAVAPEFWFVTHELYQFGGRYGIFGAAATAQITYDAFKRYPDVRSAVAAMNGAAP
jgi:hypothetical protein